MDSLKYTWMAFLQGAGVQPWPRISNLDYLSLDFNSASPSPVQKVGFNQIQWKSWNNILHDPSDNSVLQHSATGALGQKFLHYFWNLTIEATPKYFWFWLVQKNCRKGMKSWNQLIWYEHIHQSIYLLNSHSLLICSSPCLAEAFSVWWAQSWLRTGGREEDSGAAKHQNGVDGCSAQTWDEVKQHMMHSWF